MDRPLSLSMSSTETNATLRERGGAFLAVRSFFTRPVIQTRAGFSLIGLALSWLSSLFGHPVLGSPAEFTRWIVGYLLVTVAVTAVLGDWIRRKVLRAVPEFLDIALISIVVNNTGLFASPWFLLYLF